MPKSWECPICGSDIDRERTWKRGEEIYCGYCSTPFKIVENDEGELEPDLKEY